MQRTSNRTTEVHIARRQYASYKDAVAEGLTISDPDNFFQNNEIEKLALMRDKWEIQWVGKYMAEQQEKLEKGLIIF